MLLVGGTSFVWKDEFIKKYKEVNSKSYSYNIVWSEKDAVQMNCLGAAIFSRLVNAKDYFKGREYSNRNMAEIII
jgi:hypothetical protein